MTRFGADSLPEDSVSATDTARAGRKDPGAGRRAGRGEDSALTRRMPGCLLQKIFLTDVSSADNIALGVLPERIDHEQVERCARMA